MQQTNFLRKSIQTGTKYSALQQYFKINFQFNTTTVERLGKCQPSQKYMGMIWIDNSSTEQKIKAFILEGY